MTKLKEDFEASGGVWKEWRIGDLFEKIQTNTLKYKVKDLEGKYDEIFNLPALTAGIENQGLSCFVPRSNATVLKNVISVSANGANTGVMYYQPNEFTVLQDSYAIKHTRKDDTSKNEYMFFVSVLQKTIRGNYTWSEKAGWERIKNEKVSIPIALNGTVSYSYMEQYITMLEEEKMLQVDKFLKDSGLNDTTLTAEETSALEKFRNGEVKFEERKIGELFSCKTGDVDVQRCHLNGKGTIYINSGVTDLGIIGKTDMKARIFPANTITIDMFGNAYYRDFEYKMATHAHVFSLSHLDDKLNKENGLYICASLGYFTQLFSFNDMCNWSKMKDKKVCLPQRQDGDIDYTFMQHFISALEKLVIRGVVKYKDKVLNAYDKALDFAVAAE